MKKGCGSLHPVLVPPTSERKEVWLAYNLSINQRRLLLAEDRARIKEFLMQVRGWRCGLNACGLDRDIEEVAECDSFFFGQCECCLWFHRAPRMKREGGKSSRYSTGGSTACSSIHVRSGATQSMTAWKAMATSGTSFTACHN